jgi:hypothetical protein
VGKRLYYMLLCVVKARKEGRAAGGARLSQWCTNTNLLVAKHTLITTDMTETKDKTPTDARGKKRRRRLKKNLV